MKRARIEGQAFVYGDHIDTDVLAPGAYMKRPIQELAAHCLEAIDPDFARTVRPGDVLLGGIGFGIGSSREQAAQALKELGVACVLAKSFARIFYRNAINLGLPALVFAEVDRVQPGDRLHVDIASGRIDNLSRNETYQAEAMPDFLLALIADGGLVPHLKKRFAG